MDMTPSKPVAEAQIGKLNQNVTARLLKHKAEIPSDIFQEILGDETLIDDIHSLIRKRVEARSNMIVRSVKVDRTRTPKKVLDATGRTQYVSDDVVKAMPKGEGEEVEVIFFKPAKEFYKNGVISDADLEKAYALVGLVPADVYSQAAVNEADPAFADEHPNGTHWKDKGDNWCFATFGRWSADARFVYVRRLGSGWSDIWWFAGLRKKN